MKFQFKQLICLAALATFGTTFAAEIPTADDQYIDLTEATCDGCNVNNGTIENTRVNTSFSFTLTNAEAQPYELSFDASLNKRDPAVLSLTVMNGEDKVYEGTVETRTTGNWNNFLSYKCFLGTLPAGTLTMTIKVESVKDSYAGNFKNFAVRVAEAKQEVTIPTANGKFFDIANTAYLSGCNYSTKTPEVENSKLNAVIKFNINNTQESAYTLAFRAALKCEEGQSATVRFTLAGNDYESVQELVISRTEAWTRYNDYTCEFPNLPIGKYTLTMTVVKLDGTGYAGNFRDFKMTANTASGINAIQVQSGNVPTEYYDVNGIRLQSEPASGFFIVKKGSKFTKIVK